jgi:hypothetical protein
MSSSHLGLRTTRSLAALHARVAHHVLANPLQSLAAEMTKWVLLLIILLSTACVAGDAGEPAPDDAELAELDQWAAAADGKADLPSTWSEVVAWLRDVYRNRMSAIWYEQEHPATAAAALDRIRRLVAAEGGDATRILYPTTVQKLRAGQIDHSEVDIRLPGGTIIRLVGDPKGAGAFVDNALFEETVGPGLCLTWSELQTAIEASYFNGIYADSFVCHNITERVLRALRVGPSVYSSQFRTYAAARWVWGPQIPSFNSTNPAEWAVSRQCR